MLKNYFNLMLFCCLFTLSANSQSFIKKIKIAPEFQLLAGGVMESPYDLLIGGRVQYDVYGYKNMRLSVSHGFGTDMGGARLPKRAVHPFIRTLIQSFIQIDESKLVFFDTHLAATFRKGKRITPYISLGAYYAKETHSISLIEGNRKWNEDRLGWSTIMGVNFRTTKRFSPGVFFRHSDDAFTTVGLKLNYSL